MTTTKIQRRATTGTPFVSTFARDVDRVLSQTPTLFQFPFGRPFTSMFPLTPMAKEFSWLPAAEMVETTADYVITAEVPGLKKEDLKVEYADGVLIVTGEKTEEVKHEEAQSCFCERSYGAFQRGFAFATDVDPDKVTATVKDGVLNIRVPKAPRVRVETKPIVVTDAK
jgi:HSP20 family protein